MAVSRVEIVDQNFRRFVTNWKARASRSDRSQPIREGSRLTGEVALELFESQVQSRQLDFESRRLRAKDQGFYTIGSSGHEGNVVLGRLLRTSDPTLLHYRSGALALERSRHLKSGDALYDILLSFCASSEDPVAGGRHKIWGSKALWIPPQTSTIASHLPKAIGMAMVIERAKPLKLDLPIPKDSIVCCSFGDASVNHSVALGAFNAASWMSHQHLRVPILFVCEDNGIGISVRTPSRWIETKFSNYPGFEYVAGNGLDIVSAYDAAWDAVERCRSRRAPVFLHLQTVRLLGHAGSDVETEYLTKEEIEANEAKDPLIRSAQILLEGGVATADELLSKYESAARSVDEASKKAVTRPKLRSVEEIVAPLAPFSAKAVEKEARRTDYAERRLQAFGGKESLPELQKPRHLAAILNLALADLLAKYPQMLIFGEDVAKKGGVYHVTAGLTDKFGVGRVFNTLLDETTILGLGIGAAHLGFLPVPEIQYLAYYHNAEDQIRGEAGSLQFFSNGQFRNPMVVRINSFGYQKGFGGHFHNDNSIAALRDVPGIVIAAPARGDDAVGMLRTVLAMAQVDGRVVLFLEPIALYMTKDLYEPGDGQWLCAFPPPGEAVSFGEGRVYNEKANDLTIVTYANGLHLSLRAAKILKEKYKIQARILDVRWLAPLPFNQILEEAGKSGKVLVVDECRFSGGMAEPILAFLAESKLAPRLKLARLSAVDTYVPLGPSANLVLPSEQQVVEAAQRLVEKS
ncbi:MAG TPA: thiamine pyrophosphate-dependent enzyme [Bdellovibrionota bacterium]|nr:thiamine pyrophosphate-dependent enzyme [Bdellovibrionota bacterium]